MLLSVLFIFGLMFCCLVDQLPSTQGLMQGQRQWFKILRLYYEHSIWLKSVPLLLSLSAFIYSCCSFLFICRRFVVLFSVILYGIYILMTLLSRSFVQNICVKFLGLVFRNILSSASKF